jgi:hypothetical protein
MSVVALVRPLVYALTLTLAVILGASFPSSLFGTPIISSQQSSPAQRNLGGHCHWQSDFESVYWWCPTPSAPCFEYGQPCSAPWPKEVVVGNRASSLPQP